MRPGAPDIAIGLTVVPIGISLSDRCAKSLARFGGNPEFGMGRVLRNDVTNILQILGAAIAAGSVG